MLPQFLRRTHPARDRLEAAGRRWPGVWSLVDAMREQQARSWPPYVYLPLTAASGVLTAHRARIGIAQEPGGMVGAQAGDAAELACLASWRMTQGIYRYDPALYEAIVDTPLTGDVPADMLRRLPEWCVYVECTLPVPRLGLEPMTTRGIYGWLDHDERAGHDVLWIGWDIEPEVIALTAVPLVGTVTESAERVVDDWREAIADGAATDMPPAEALVEAYRATLPPALSLLLYLCSDAPDITLRGQPARPELPQPKRTRRDGWRLFPADGSRTWDVGVRLGAALRRAYHAEQTGQGGDTHAGPRAHIRRAHWHTFVSGARLRSDGSEVPLHQRRRDLRWLPPIPVNLAAVDDLPSVIRPVQP